MKKVFTIVLLVSAIFGLNQGYGLSRPDWVINAEEAVSEGSEEEPAWVIKEKAAGGSESRFRDICAKLHISENLASKIEEVYSKIKSDKALNAKFEEKLDEFMGTSPDDSQIEDILNDFAETPSAEIQDLVNKIEDPEWVRKNEQERVVILFISVVELVKIALAVGVALVVAIAIIVVIVKAKIEERRAMKAAAF